jgi:hypothetical protein
MIYNERPIEYSFVFKWLVKLYPQRVLDVGTGMSALPALMKAGGFDVTAIDNYIHYFGKVKNNPHFKVLKKSVTEFLGIGKFDFITCISTLEHIIEYKSAVENMAEALNSGGYLIMTFPFNRYKYCANVYDTPQARDNLKHKPRYILRVLSDNELVPLINELGLSEKSREYWCCWTGEFWRQGEQIIPPIRSVGGDEQHQLICISLMKQ